MFWQPATKRARLRNPRAILRQSAPVQIRIVGSWPVIAPGQGPRALPQMARRWTSAPDLPDVSNLADNAAIPAGCGYLCMGSFSIFWLEGLIGGKRGRQIAGIVPTSGRCRIPVRWGTSSASRSGKKQDMTRADAIAASAPASFIPANFSPNSTAGSPIGPRAKIPNEAMRFAPISSRNCSRHFRNSISRPG